jgi:hypothetical protein
MIGSEYPVACPAVWSTREVVSRAVQTIQEAVQLNLEAVLLAALSICAAVSSHNIAVVAWAVVEAAQSLRNLVQARVQESV